MVFMRLRIIVLIFSPLYFIAMIAVRITILVILKINISHYFVIRKLGLAHTHLISIFLAFVLIMNIVLVFRRPPIVRAAFIIPSTHISNCSFRFAYGFIVLAIFLAVVIMPRSVMMAVNPIIISVSATVLIGILMSLRILAVS